MNITLLHPSRGRALKSFNNTKRWFEKSGIDMNVTGTPLKVIVSIDSDDKEATQYHQLYQSNYATVTVNNNKSVVDATNIAAKKAEGDILIYLSDDFDCPDNWGQLILKEFEGVTEPRLIKVDDMLQPFHVAVLTIPIMNRALYEKLGYFWHPDFKSMFVDEQLYWKAKKLGALKMCPHLKFPHEHVSIGKADNDETYKRSAANWEQGKAMFAKHKASDFTL